LNKPLNFILPLTPYPFDLMVSVGETDEMLFKRLGRYTIGEEEMQDAKYEGDTGQGRYCLFKCGASLIRIKGKPKTPEEKGTLAHEIFHCAASVLWRVGIKLKILTSDEVYAYFCGFLTTEIYKRLD